MVFRDSEPKRFDFSRTREAVAIVCAASALTLVGCEKPLTPEQRATTELQSTADASADTIINLLARPESSSRANGNDYLNPAAANLALAPTYPTLYAQGIERNGKNWIQLGSEVREQPASPKWTSITLLYEASTPLRGSETDPLTIDEIQQATSKATLTAATVRIASGHPYSVVFLNGEGSANITQNLIPAIIDNRAIETDPTYELLKTTDIVLSSATDKILAAANTYNK